jgi:hypothetical protein
MVAQRGDGDIAPILRPQLVAHLEVAGLGLARCFEPGPTFTPHCRHTAGDGQLCLAVASY